MTKIIWKCYRCALAFEDESIAIIHNDIMKHPILQIN